MRTKKLGQILVNDALIILDEAQQSFDRQHWHRKVRKSQEAVELAIKGLLRWAGIEYSKVHKIGKSFKNSKVLTVLTPEEVQRFAAIADNLALNRELSFYGSDDMGAPELFGREAAQKALDECRLIVGRAEKIVFAEQDSASLAQDQDKSSAELKNIQGESNE